MANEFIARNGVIAQNNSTVSGSLVLAGSGSGLFTVTGTKGRILTVDDTNSGSLFSVVTGSTSILEVFSSNLVIITGSLNVNGGITGSLLGSASYALTASYALNSSGGGGISTGSNTFYGDQIISGSLTVTGSASANIFLYPQTASSVVVPTGYNGLLITPIQLIGSSSVEMGSRLVIL